MLYFIFSVVCISAAQGFSQFGFQHTVNPTLRTPHAPAARFQHAQNSHMRGFRRTLRTHNGITCQESGSGHVESAAPAIKMPSPSLPHPSSTPVPTNMDEAVRVFWEHPTPRIVGVALTVMAACRVSLGPFGPEDLVATVAMAVLWIFQEWALHRYLLHSESDNIGSRIHKDHHKVEYFHVCIDSIPLSVGWTAAATVIFMVLLPLPPTLGLSCLFAYMCMGLHYEWSHYLAHTKAVPSTWLWKQSKAAHTKHHLTDDSLWYCFTLPVMDDVFNTSGEKTKVE